MRIRESKSPGSRIPGSVADIPLGAKFIPLLPLDGLTVDSSPTNLSNRSRFVNSSQKSQNVWALHSQWSLCLSKTDRTNKFRLLTSWRKLHWYVLLHACPIKRGPTSECYVKGSNWYPWRWVDLSIGRIARPCRSLSSLVQGYCDMQHEAPRFRPSPLNDWKISAHRSRTRSGSHLSQYTNHAWAPQTRDHEVEITDTYNIWRFASFTCLANTVMACL